MGKLALVLIQEPQNVIEVLQKLKDGVLSIENIREAENFIE